MATTSGGSSLSCLCDVRLLHLWVAGVEHSDLVAVLTQNRRKRLDAERRESHHLDPQIVRLRSAQLFRQQPVEILIVYEYEEYFQNVVLSVLGR